MSDAADQRFAPPQAHVEDQASDGAVLAGRGARLMAGLVDGTIAAVVFWAVMQIPLLKPLAQSQVDEATAGMWTWRPMSLAISAALFLVIQGWPLLTRGQTLGKMLFKMRIVRPDGSKPDAWRLLGLRYGIGVLLNVNVAVAMVYSLVDSLLIFRASRKCLHDTIADTQVVKL